jgi:hypothetical protein
MHRGRRHREGSGAFLRERASEHKAVMTMPVTVNEVLDGRAAPDLECLDRDRHEVPVPPPGRNRIEAFLARFECGGCEPLPPLERRRQPPPVPLRRAALTKGARASRSLPVFSSDSSTSYTRRSRPKVTVSEASAPSRSSTNLTRTVRATVRVRSEKCPCHPRSWSSRQRPSQPSPSRTLPRGGRRALASVISSATVGLTGVHRPLERRSHGQDSSTNQRAAKPC